MHKQNPRLGKGLDALIPALVSRNESSVDLLPIDRIRPNPFQPRKYMDPTALAELAHSIKIHGLTQPIVVRPVGNDYEIVVGERRFQACKLNEFTTIPAIVKSVSDKESCEIAIVENIDRENLSVIEIAQSFQNLVDTFGYTQEKLSHIFARSRSSIANIMRLLKLPESVQQLMIEGALLEGHARTLVDHSHDPDTCLALARDIIDKKLTVRQAEAWGKASKKKRPSKTVAIFDQYATKLSKTLNTPVDIRHNRNNQLTVTESYPQFKAYIAFLDQLCTIEMPPSES